MQLNYELKASDLKNKLDRFWELSAKKINLIEKEYDESKGSPVFTINGKYSTRGWTEWTQGFQFGCAILTFDATDDRKLLELGRSRTIESIELASASSSCGTRSGTSAVNDGPNSASPMPNRMDSTTTCHRAR